MGRLAFILLVVGTLVGALMPGDASIEQPAEEAKRVTMVDPAPADAEEVPAERVEQLGDFQAMAVERSGDGHFYVDAQVNGAPVHFIVDTGASGIALSAGDARRAGVLFTNDEFAVIGRGASGPVRGKFVTFDRVTLGTKTVENISGAVLEGGQESLLGQNFLQHFDAVEIRGDRLTLR